ncbi:MAG: hypothetical protein WBN06_01520, partial [Lysobacterales bacterium]
QDERYIAGEHMDVRRDCVQLAQRPRMNGISRVSTWMCDAKHPWGRVLGFGPGHPLEWFPLSPRLSRTVLKQDTTSPRLRG